MRLSGLIAARAPYIPKQLCFGDLHFVGCVAAATQRARQAKARSRKRSAEAPCGPEEDAGMKPNGAKGLAQIVFPVNDESRAGLNQ